MSKDKKIMITGGHSTPAFALVDELMIRDINNFVWVSEKYNQRGTKNESPEYNTVVRKYRIKFINIHAGKLVRKWEFSTFISGILELINLFVGFIQGFFIVMREQPKLVVSFGGFLAVPIVFWAKIFRIKIITHEQTIVTGLANKIISKFADKILISFKESAKYYPKKKTEYVGNPIRKDIFKIESNLTSELSPEFPTVYITGGNQGANEINRRVLKLLPKLLERANVIHQTGNSTITNDYSKAMQLKSNLSPEVMKRYIVKDYVSADEIGEVFNKADLVFARSGANTILEILALGKMAVLMPIPWASHDEQTKNAMIVVESGLGKLIKQEDSLTYETVLSALNEGLDKIADNKSFDGGNLKEKATAAKRLVNLNAAEKFADIVQETLA